MMINKATKLRKMKTDTIGNYFLEKLTKQYKLWTLMDYISQNC